MTKVTILLESILHYYWHHVKFSLRYISRYKSYRCFHIVIIWNKNYMPFKKWLAFSSYSIETCTEPKMENAFLDFNCLCRQCRSRSSYTTCAAWSLIYTGGFSEILKTIAYHEFSIVCLSFLQENIFWDYSVL